MANKFGRYVWLIEQFRQYGRLTFDEISRHWEESGLSYEEPLPKRTFHNHRAAILDIFQVDILCDPQDGYRYYIDNPEELEQDNLRSWLIDSYTAMNQIQADSKLQGRILFEHVPSGRKWLNVIAEAMRHGKVIQMTYQGFGRPEAYSFEAEPYYLKVANRRWYLLARSPYYSARNVELNAEDGGSRPKDVYLVYALDRILACEPLEESFVMDESFDIEAYYRGCCGVIHSEEEPVHLLVNAYDQGADYLRTLPIHESQRELPSEVEGVACFELEVCPTYDLYQALLAMGDQIEVLEPQSVREEMYNFAKNLMAYYEPTSEA